MAPSWRFYLLPLLTSGGLLMAGCRKSADPVPPPTQTTLLTGPKWRVTANTFTESANGVTRTEDTYAKTRGCYLDNYVKFNRDQTLTLDEGPTTCPQSVPQNLTYAWKFNADESALLYGPDASSYATYEVRQLTAATLHLRQTVTAPNYQAVFDVTYSAF